MNSNFTAAVEKEFSPEIVCSLSLNSSLFSSGLSVDDFIKKINVLKITKTGARKLSNITNTIAMSEGLYAHGYSAMLRK